MIIKLVTKVKERMHEQNEFQQINRKYKIFSNRRNRTEKYKTKKKNTLEVFKD